MPFSDRIIRMRTVLDRTGLSRSTLYRKMGLKVERDKMLNS